MSNLMATLGVSANALDVMTQALGVIQNNIDNSSTPGYATQSLRLEAMPLDVATGAAGGVASNGLIDSRDQYLESAVQNQLQTLGLYTAQSQGTSAIQSYFGTTGANGVAGALNTLFTAFSAWSASPNDPTAQQTVLSGAAGVASAIQGLSTSLDQTAQQVDQQVTSTVQQINSLASQIQQYNVSRLQNGQPDPGADAQLNTALESLSQLTNTTVLHQANGTVTVLVGGGTPLVDGAQQYSLSSSFSVDSAGSNSQSLPTAHILDSQGDDITSDITNGQLAGLINTRNQVLGSIIGDSQQPGSLNQFAQGLADTINNILESGTTSTAPNAAAGTALFSYNNADPTLAASTISLNPNITGAQLAPVDSSGNANGNANALADLANPTSAQGEIDGMSYTQFFAQIGAGVGQQNQTAQDNTTAQQQIVTQSESLRDQISGVSLDAQAALVLQFQRGYEAVAQAMTIINGMVDYAIQLIPPASG
jgi:flagellar hook-associated protein 1 FlgK